MNRKIKKAIELIAFFVYNRIGSVFMQLNDKKVVFASEARETIKGNLKVIYEKMPDGYNKVVHVKSDRRDTLSIKETLVLWQDLTTAKYILLDDFYGLTSAMKVREGQELVQLWHGSGAFKKFGFSRIETGDNIKSVHTGYRKYTKAIVTAEPIRQCFAEAFDIDVEKVQAVGSPRTDIFFDEASIEATRKKVYEIYPELKNKKVVLIAPTYRGRKVEDAHYDFDILNVEQLLEDLRDEYQIIVKWHPALYNNIKRGLCKYNSDKVIDASPYNDINDLLLVSDILVTDYSSVIFDWYLLNKPIVYFTYDLDEYEKDRGLYYEFDEYVYGTVAKNYTELVDAIKKEDLLEEKRQAFGNKFMNSCAGNSAINTIKWILLGEKSEVDSTGVGC